jgi:hypothetical protein
MQSRMTSHDSNRLTCACVCAARISYQLERQLRPDQSDAGHDASAAQAAVLDATLPQLVQRAIMAQRDAGDATGVHQVRDHVCELELLAGTLLPAGSHCQGPQRRNWRRRLVHVCERAGAATALDRRCVRAHTASDCGHSLFVSSSMYVKQRCVPPQTQIGSKIILTSTGLFSRRDWPVLPPWVGQTPPLAPTWCPAAPRVGASRCACTHSWGMARRPSNTSRSDR